MLNISAKGRARFERVFSPAVVEKTRRRTRFIIEPNHARPEAFTAWLPFGRARIYARGMTEGLWFECKQIQVHEFAHAVTIIGWPWRSLVAPTLAHETIACAAVHMAFSDADATVYGRIWNETPGMIHEAWVRGRGWAHRAHCDGRSLDELIPDILGG